MHPPIDGFWLPSKLRDELLSPETEYVRLSCMEGKPCEPTDEGAVTARWPRLSLKQWQRLLAALRENRLQAPRGDAYWERLQIAMAAVGERFARPSDSVRKLALKALPGYTGYSEAMIRLSLGALNMFSLDQLPSAFAFSPSHRVARGWEAMPGLPGRLRFYNSNFRPGWLRQLHSMGDRPLFNSMASPKLVIGYGAGNVPGTATLITFLAQATSLAGGLLPVAVVKNSRHEPIFSPLVLNAIEDVDPDLVSNVAVLVWDYDDAATQDYLLGQADLVIAAASDETIVQIQAQVDTANQKRARSPIRFHAHGHKVSFSAISRDVLAHANSDQVSGKSILEVVALLAALDSIIWDQHGCLSSRVHFVETGAEDYFTPFEYASQLEAQLRLLASFLPRGAWPRAQIHDRFDHYKLLETNGQVLVLSSYGDEFLVVLDQRPLNAAAFQTTVNDCQGRVIIVRPVADLMEIPNKTLRLLPRENLQSLSVAVGKPAEGITSRFLRLAEACGERGITAIRTVGRGAFPQLSHSWDGYIPLDLVRGRPRGYFSSIEFEAPYEQMLTTYRLFDQVGLAYP